MTFLVRVTAIAVAAFFVTSGSAQAATPLAADTGALHGSGRIVFPPGPDDEVWFTVDAHARYADPAGGPFPSQSWGTAKVTHHFAVPDLTSWYTMTVDCLMTGGHTATFTGIVDAAAPGAQNLIGQRIGFSVADLGRHDEVGFMVDVATPCTAPATYFDVVEGGYTVRDGDHWPTPVTGANASFAGL